MTFEILCLDNEEKVKSRTVTTLLHALMANDSLFENPEMNDCYIYDAQKQVKLSVNQFQTDKMMTGVRYSVAFIITVESEKIEVLDDFRISLVDYVKEIGFSNIRILADEVSAKLAAELYPVLYSLENQVRTFVINFFLKNLGVNWTQFAMSGETLQKIKSRKGNDKIFTVHNRVDSDVSLIDFDELGKILYNENSILSGKKADNVTILMKRLRMQLI